MLEKRPRARLPTGDQTGIALETGDRGCGRVSRLADWPSPGNVAYEDPPFSTMSAPVVGPALQYPGHCLRSCEAGIKTDSAFNRKRLEGLRTGVQYRVTRPVSASLFCTARTPGRGRRGFPPSGLESRSVRHSHATARHMICSERSTAFARLGGCLERGVRLGDPCSFRARFQAAPGADARLW